MFVVLYVFLVGLGVVSVVVSVVPLDFFLVGASVVSVVVRGSGGTYLSFKVLADLSRHLPSSKPLSSIQEEAASMVRVVVIWPWIFLQNNLVLV